MKIAMLLIWVLFLATAVEALPGAGGRQLAKDKKPKKCEVDVCWKKCQKLKGEEAESASTPGAMLKALVEPPPQCDIAYIETCLEASSDVATCKKKCKAAFKTCKATKEVCKKNLKKCMKECGKPEPLDCSFLKGKKKKKCCEKKCEKSPDLDCIETCIAA